MKSFPLFLALCLWLSAAVAHGQWQTTTYTLKGGWNAIYLTGDAKQDTLDNLFPAQVLEVWRWNSNPSQVQFTESPSIPSAGTPEWNVWKRDSPAQSDFTQLIGQSAYLVKCTGTTANTYSVALKQSPLPPGASWVRNGANLMGFPTFKNGANYPTFSSYFSTFPAAIAAPGKIFKYIGGDLNASNPLLVASTSIDKIDRTQAYWFSSEVVGNFYAPLEISSSSPRGLDFGRSGSVITVLVRNRGTTPITLTMTHESSESQPSGQTSITGDVPLTRRILDPATLVWIDTPLTTPVVIAGQSTVELTFGINRIAMTGAADSLYASLLRFRDSGNLLDAVLPVRAQKSSFTGLWVGDATIRNVSSEVPGSGTTLPPDSNLYKLRVLIHVDGGGTARLLSQVFLGTLAEPNNPVGLCTKETGLLQAEKADAVRLSVAHLPLDRVIDGTGEGNSGSVAAVGSLVRRVSIPFNDPTNPFIHQYHPDHDSKDARPDGTNVLLGNGKESYTVTRDCTFEFTAFPPASAPVGAGGSVIGGNYIEVLTGLHKHPLTTSGTFLLRRASEIGTITVNN